jgi:HECT-like Ubiquitin-conjugating enzyme (E2)-binding
MRFFAERLVRLGIVNLQIELGTTSDESTHISFAKGESKAAVVRDVEEYAIPLGCLVHASQELSFPASQSIITCRASTLPSNSVYEPKPLLSADDFKLSSCATICCSSCERDIIANKQMRWKDLPSDSWIEFSDYWHCHSGHEHSHGPHEHSTHPGGTEISTIPVIKAVPGMALIGSTFLLIHPDDTQHLIIKVLAPFPLPIWSLDLKKASVLYTQTGADTKVPKKIENQTYLGFKHLAIRSIDKGRHYENIRDDIFCFNNTNIRMTFFVNVERI